MNAPWYGAFQFPRKEVMIKLCVLYISFLSTFLYSETAIENYYRLFKNGDYQNAQKSLLNSKLELNQPGLFYYLKAITYNKLQSYDQAAINFKKAIEFNYEASDLYYEYGQSLYAMNDLKNARIAFKKSSELHFNRLASLYYQAHISQILEEFTEAQKVYQEILKDKKCDQNFEQLSKFQLAEISLALLRQSEISKEKKEVEVEKRILIQYKNALNVSLKSKMANDIEVRIDEIQREFHLDPNILKNGRRINPKRFNAYIDVKAKYDNNVTNTSLENDRQQSKKESILIETEAEVRYDLIYKKRFVSTPVVRINYGQYLNQEDKLVYQNDSVSFYGSLKNKFEHTIFNDPASLIFDVDLSKTYKDYEQNHTKKSYADALTFSIGESFSIFSFGDTTLKFKLKKFQAYNSLLNNKTKIVTLDQSAMFSNSHLMIFLIEADLVDNYNSPISSSNAYTLRLDYIIPEIFPKYNLTLSLANTFTDTLEQSQQRGLETTINPSLELSREMNRRLRFMINFDYSINSSKSDIYSYKKSITTFELKYSF